MVRINFLTHDISCPLRPHREPRVIDWAAIESGLIDELQITATNYGLIAANDLTYTWLRYWRNTLFILPDEETDKSRERNVGTLAANSTITFPIRVIRLLEYEIPLGWGEMRDGNDVTLFRDNSEGDPENLAGDVIVIPGDDPVDGQYFVKHNSRGLIEFVYDYGPRELHVPLYDADDEILDLTTTMDADFPDSRRLHSFGLDVVEPIKLVQPQKELEITMEGDQRSQVAHHQHRRLERCQITDLVDPCAACRAAKKGATKLVCSRVKYLKYCDAKWSPIKKVCGWVVKKVCEEVPENLPDPCKSVCEKSESLHYCPPSFGSEGISLRRVAVSAFLHRPST